MVTTAQWKSRYRIGAAIGMGGFKRVHRAVELESGDEVAFAELFEFDPDDFEREVELLRRVAPEHVAAVRDSHLDRTHGEGYIVFELCEGPTLAQLVAKEPMAVDRAAPVMVAFARGLEAVHAAHVLHRDVKLENVVLAPRGAKLRLSILDFGLARRATDEKTCAGSVGLAGTVEYLAPEAVRGERTDARSDVFALGICFFRLLTGSFPDERGGGSAYDRLRAAADGRVLNLAGLPQLPDRVHTVLARMLDPRTNVRPYMPEVVRELEAGFGGMRPLQLDDAEDPTVRTPGPVWAMEWSVPIEGATPSTILPSHCGYAPVVAWSPRRPTIIHALTREGAIRWRAEVDVEVRAGVRADLDRDGVRELYLVGDDRIVSLDARGKKRFERPLHKLDDERANSGSPSLLVIPSGRSARLAIDGVVYNGDGAPSVRIPLACEGDGARLIDAPHGRGLAYNGLAHQAFRGASETAAAIVHAPGANEFLVAHLEEARGAPRAVLSVYGPGGARRHRFSVADAELATGDRAEVEAMFDRKYALFGPEQAPIAVLDASGGAILIVPFLGPPRPMPSLVVAFSTELGAELWRQPWGPGAVVLGDADGDGQPEVIAGDGQTLVAWSPADGERRGEQRAPGVPAAIGDPFGVGRTFLFTAGPHGIDVLRGPECLPGRMQWVGPRGDLWRSGAMRADGQPFGSI